MMKTSKTLFLLLLATIVAGNMQAQETGDSWTPTADPPEPYVTYRITTEGTPADKCKVSGKGYFKTGSTVLISSSSLDTDYEFKHWLKDGVKINKPASFYYTVEQADVKFIAVYELKPYDPASPGDPFADYKYHLYLDCEPEDACSFNFTSGERFKEGTWKEVEARPSQGFEFVGWYSGNSLVSESLAFNYQIGSQDETLTARFIYNPVSPDDPSCNLPTFQRGDANQDGYVDATDVTDVINIFLHNNDYSKAHDINFDGVVDATDATAIVNIFLKK